MRRVSQASSLTDCFITKYFYINTRSFMFLVFTLSLRQSSSFYRLCNKILSFKSTILFMLSNEQPIEKRGKLQKLSAYYITLKNTKAEPSRVKIKNSLQSYLFTLLNFCVGIGDSSSTIIYA
jgi:hypothetical protein